MQYARSFVFPFNLAFHQATRHLYTNAEHGLGYFDVLTLQERLGVFGEVQGYQGTLVLGTAQLDATVWQFDNF